jgi:hypothetical protein
MMTASFGDSADVIDFCFWMVRSRKIAVLTALFVSES